MPTAVEFMMKYRSLEVPAVVEDSAQHVSRVGKQRVQLRKYFMMDWTDGTEERRDYNKVSQGSKNDVWFKTNKERIRTAAMGKGAPQDFELALEWAVRSGKVPTPTQATLQTFCDEHLGIDCSGFVTNYLCACGKKAYSSQTVRNTSAASYFNAANAVNDSGRIRQGDLLVWMQGNSVKSNPGHVAVVDSFNPQSRAGGNMRVVEATGSSGASPKLLDSLYTVEQIIPKGGAVPAMILVVKRHGVSGSRVTVMRV
jgi:CHAP domain